MKFILYAILFFSQVDYSVSSEWTPIPIVGVSMKCFEEKLPVEWSFCINKTPHSSNRNLIYHFHGRNGDATWWNDMTYYTGKVHSTWLLRNEQPPTVVSISFGKLWLLIDNQNDIGNLYRFFFDHVMKRVEQELNQPIERRLAVGESMGGVNVLILALKSKGTFSKVASLCPVLPPVSPFAPLKELYDYVVRSSMSLKRAFMVYWFSKIFYPSLEIWEENDPLYLSRSFDPNNAPSLYLSCGEKDEWGCLEGSTQFVTNIRKTGGKIEWHQRPGGHCDVDVESLATFLSGSK